MPGRKSTSGRRRPTKRAKARSSKGKGTGTRGKAKKGSRKKGKKPRPKDGRGKRRGPKKGRGSQSKKKRSSRPSASTNKENGGKSLVALKGRISSETKKKREIEERIAQRDGEIEDIEKRLNTLMMKYRKSGRKEERGQKAGSQVNEVRVKRINTRGDKKIVTGGTDLEHRRLLELTLEKERAELDLLRKLAKLQSREQALKEREDTVREVEEEVEKYLSNNGPDEVMDALKENLEERLAILEIRDNRLDLIEGELDKLERVMEGLAPDGDARTKRKGRRRRRGPRSSSKDE